MDTMTHMSPAVATFATRDHAWSHEAMARASHPADAANAANPACKANGARWPGRSST